MDIYEGKCTCSSDCARTLLVEPVYRVIVYDDDDRLSATQTMTRAELLDWLSSDDDCIVEDADNLYSIEPDAAAVHAWLDGTEADDLRRQVEHANRWRDVAIVEANEARAEAADLRRQFEQERVEIGMLRRQLQEGEQSALSHAIGQIFYLRRQLAEAETALLAVPLDSIRRWMVHSDAIEAVAAGDYDAGEGMLDLYLIRDWLSGLATDATPATGEAESAMGTIRLTLQQLEDGQAESTNSPTDTPATGEAE